MGRVDEKMREYRESHKRCKFCSYCKRGGPVVFPEFPDWFECQLKDKIIHRPAMPRPWCKWFEVKDYVGYGSNN